MFPALPWQKMIVPRDRTPRTNQAAMRTPSPAEIHARMPESAKGDLMEWSAGQDFSGATASMLGREIDTARLLNSDPAVAITDDRPYNEYFFLRRTADRIRGEVTETL